MADEELDLHRPRLSRSQWLWLVRGIFTVFAAVVTLALVEAILRDQWLSVVLLSALLVSVPCIARFVVYGGDL